MAEETFRGFTPEQAANYSKYRGEGYPETLYKTIRDYHQGERRTIFDIGTGPGQVVFNNLPHFERGYGCDTSEQMIEKAKQDARQFGVEDKVQFSVCGGEECDKAIPEADRGKIDIITVAMTAHWLDMSAFYNAVAKVLRPGGTLAIWTCSNMYVHPTTPNAVKVQKILSDLQEVHLAPYSTPGNRLSDLAYKTLPLPWDIPVPSTAFKESTFVRRDWDLDGIPSSPDLPDGTPGPFLSNDDTNLESLKNALGSASMVVRWRDAHPDKAYTADDCVYLTIREMKEALGGVENVDTAASTSLLLMRRE